MSFFFKALMAYSFPVALYWASSTWKTTEKLYFKQSHISLSDYFNSNWHQLFPSISDSHPQNQTQGTQKTEHFCFAPCAAEGCQCKLCPSPKQRYHSWPSALGAPQSSHRGSYAQFWEWSSSSSDPHERNGNSVIWFSTLGTAFSRLWSHKSSGILTVNNSYQLLSWVCCSVSALQQISLVLQCFYSDPRQSPTATTTAPLHSVLLYYLPKVATAQHSDAVKILELHCPFPEEKQRRDSTQEMHEQVTKDCVFVSREEALYSKKGKQTAVPTTPHLILTTKAWAAVLPLKKEGNPDVRKLAAVWLPPVLTTITGATILTLLGLFPQLLSITGLVPLHPHPLGSKTPFQLRSFKQAQQQL